MPNLRELLKPKEVYSLANCFLSRVSRSIFLIIFYILFFNITYSQSQTKTERTKLFSVGGSLGLNAGYYSVNGIPPRYSTWNYQLLGNVTFDILGITLPFSIVLSEQNRSYSQPFNNFGTSPRYKWITAHLGWRNLTYSPFTLNGHTFWGAGIELNPWLFRISAMYGRFKKAVAGDTNNLLIFPPSYQRNGYAFKFGFGSSASFVDLIVFRASDDIHSLDTNSQKLIKPAENLVLGITSKLRIFDNFRFEIDGSASLYTLNLNSETIDIDSISKVPKFLSRIYNLRLSTQFSTAIQSSLTFSSDFFTAKLSYKRIEPDYKSMGIYFSESDVQSYTASLSIPMLNRKVRFSGSIGYQHDNLLNNKAKTSKRIVGSAGLSFFSRIFGADISYSTYGISQSKGLFPVIDSLRYSRVNQNANLNLRLTLPKNVQVWNFSLSSFIQKTSAEEPTSNLISSSVSYGGNFSINYSHSKSKLNVVLSANLLTSETGGVSTSFFGPSINFSKIFNRISLNTQIGYQFSQFDKGSNGGILNGNLSSAFQIDNHNEIRMDLNLLNAIQKMEKNFNELRIAIGYSYRF